MGIQPIDLQTMYSQLSNLSKTIGGQEQASQLNTSIQQQNQVQRNLENSTKVQHTSNDKSGASTINADGRNGSGSPSANQNKGDKSDKNGDKNSENSHTSGNPYKESYLGTIIDITR